ncbi:leucine-rich repeat protein [Anaerobutyricum hallii]|uniref:leucine-rich repeat protein n=1 Tax=Anaerobutyricum hallii TaxID=39488 RepID=UPI0035220E73
MKTMSDDLFQRPKKKENDMSSDTSSGTSQNTQKINEMDLFGDVEKREHSTEPEKSTIEEQLQNYSNNSEDAFSMDDNLSSLFSHEASSDNATKAKAAEEANTSGLKAEDKREVKFADAFNMDNDLSSLFNREINSNETTKEDKDSVDEALDKKAPKQIDLYADTENKHVQGYEIPNTKNTSDAKKDVNKDVNKEVNRDVNKIADDVKHFSQEKTSATGDAKHFSQEKTSFADVSMKTRSSKVGDYIDKIKAKLATETPGEKLNKTKDENGDKVTIEDKIYNSLETGCDVALDLMEGAGENLAFRLKRGATSLFSSFQNKMLKKKFKRNDNIIQFGDFMFYEMGDELMLYKYVGISTEIKIPSYVEGMPVSYLDKNFLRFNAIKSLGRGLSIERIQDVSVESIKDNLLNIKSVQLPSTLKILPSRVFAGCKRIDELIIPASVKIVQPNAFVGCRPTRIIFLGEAPKQLPDSNLAKVRIYCKKEYFDSFFKLMRNYDDYLTDKNVKREYLDLRKKILGSEDTAIWERMIRATDISDESLIKGLHNVN